MNFHEFSHAVSKKLSQLEKSGALFRSKASPEALWETYLSAFPEGTNPLYIKRTQHDCSCCRHFIRDVGNAVAVINGKLVSMWEVVLKDDYQVVADALAKLNLEAGIDNLFCHRQQKVGLQKNTATDGNGKIRTFHHFHHQLSEKYVRNNRSEYLGTQKMRFQTLRRAFEEIDKDAVQIVLELISQNSLVRGAEHKARLQAFKKAQKGYLACDKIHKAQAHKTHAHKEQADVERAKDEYIWQMLAGRNGEFLYSIRNDVIGSLLLDLSGEQSIGLEEAVGKYEAKVAPENYKRPKALITEGMIRQAEAEVARLGIEDSLYRRYAKLSDITINNVLFANQQTKRELNVFDALRKGVSQKKPNLNKVEDISLDDFINNVLPHVSDINLYVENRHINNLVSLIAPVYEDTPNILKWDNNFCWSYHGEFTDSIKERVKAKGGNVTGEMRVSLGWYNFDDLDIHVIEPDGNKIYFSKRLSKRTQGQLDVDMNANGGKSREAVENIFWKNCTHMLEGTYQVVVHNYCKRENIDVGFELDVEFCNQRHTQGEARKWHFAYEKMVQNEQKVACFNFTYSHQRGVEIAKKDCFIDEGSQPKQVWNISTNQMRQVNAIMFSPNFWDDNSIGNKHVFFMLDDCINPDQTRGFYNEFLIDKLTPHRKVFEVLGSKIKTPETDEQLSGIGFSSTKRTQFICHVQGAFNRTLRVMV